MCRIFSDSKKISVEKKMTEKNWSKILLVGRKKVEKFENFVNFGVSLTFFVVDHSGRPRPKRVSTVILNSILLVDLRQTDGEKCDAALRGVEFLSSRLHPAKM